MERFHPQFFEGPVTRRVGALFLCGEVEFEWLPVDVATPIDGSWQGAFRGHHPVAVGSEALLLAPC